MKIVYGFSRANRDIDNPTKPLLDAMEGVVYENDKQIYELRTVKTVVSKGSDEFIKVKVVELLA